MPLRRQLDVSFGVMNPFIITCMYIMYIYIYMHWYIFHIPLCIMAALLSGFPYDNGDNLSANH